MSNSDVRHHLNEVKKVARKFKNESHSSCEDLAKDARERLYHVAKEAILEAHGNVLAGATAHDSQAECWATIIPSDQKNGGCHACAARVQYWDHGGFLSAVDCETEQKALSLMVEGGFVFADPGALPRMARTETFSEGNRLRGNQHWPLERSRTEGQSMRGPR